MSVARHLSRILSLVLIGILGWLPSAFAHEHRLSLTLSNLRAEALSEERGDEVYLSISKYSSKNPPEEFRVPSKPLNWFFKKLDDIKNISLWTGTVASEETLKFVISVVEQDNPPWDIDDLIGTVQVNVQNGKIGRPKIEWLIPKMDGQPSIEDRGNWHNQGRSYLLKGENSQYELNLDLHVG